jgi:N-acetylneuraminic acid mutarotase
MIAWGGSTDDTTTMLDTGSRYDPASDSWQPIASGSDSPQGRVFHTTVWTGSEMIVWGGLNITTLRTGGRYDPVTDSWAPTAVDTFSPSAHFHTAVWTGSEMIIWGGRQGVGTWTYAEGGAKYLCIP